MSWLRLQRIAAAADPKDGDWLCHALANWLRGAPLEVVLGLSGENARNDELRRAGRAINPDGSLSTWRTAQLLEKAIARCDLKFRAGVITSDDPIDGAILQSFVAYSRRIRSPRKLYKLLSAAEEITDQKALDRSAAASASCATTKARSHT